MGGKDSGVKPQTRDIFLESAFFSPEMIAGKARGYGLHTDSSHRFERGVDPELAAKAMERATALLMSIVGGEAGPVVAVTDNEHLPKEKEILLRAARIERVLGLALPASEVEEQLTRLGLTLTTVEQGWQVKVPSFRFDISIEVDLIEELGRLYGYDRLPQTRPVGTVLTSNITETQTPVERCQSLLVDRGYFEAITYSFVEPKLHALLADKALKPITLANPISTDLSEMRTSLWPGLIQALMYNANRQQSRVRLFEVGRVFKGDLEQMTQARHLGGVVFGSQHPEQWAEKQRAVDFYDVKADVEALLSLSGGQVHFETAQHEALHPGQTAQIFKEGVAIGWIGALHPKLRDELDISGAVYLYELSLDELLKSTIPSFSALSKFPTIRRDLALVVDDSVSSGKIHHCLRGIDSDILKSIQLFDVYSGDGVELGKKSLAIAFHLQHNERTLTDEEVDAVMETVTDTLVSSVGATVRS
jgi:phenylalanyl-tRNA synthetase beta chain